MSETLLLPIAWIGGMMLGTMFFGGLWWTVRKSLSARQPALWLFVSLMLRLSLALVGFYFIGQGDWKRLLFCLFGFVMARLVVTRLTRPPTGVEAGHAPYSG
jgi:F1F0 ATPase subunit 2